MIPLMILLKQKLEFSFRLIIFFILGTLAIVGYNRFFFMGLEVGFAGLGGVIVTTTNPIFTFAIVALIEKIEVKKQKKIALLMGLLGGIIMLRVWDFDVGNFLVGGESILPFVISILGFCYRG